MDDLRSNFVEYEERFMSFHVVCQKLVFLFPQIHAYMRSDSVLSIRLLWQWEKF